MIPNTSNMYKPIEDYIKNKLIPALTGHSCSDLERELLLIGKKWLKNQNLNRMRWSLDIFTIGLVSMS